MFLFPPSLSALGDLHGLVFIKRAGGCGGGRAGLFIAAGIIRAAFVLPAGSPPPRPGWSAASPAAAGRSRHVERQEKTCLSLPGLALPQSAEGSGGAGKEKKNQNQTNPNHPKATISLQRPGRGAPGGGGGEPAAPPPSAEENAAPKGRRSHDGGCPHTTRSATGSAVPALPAARDTVLPQPFHIINPPEFGGEAIFFSWAGWRH